MKLIKEPTSKFVRVICNNCKNEQIIFGKASTNVKCLKCGKVLVKSRGGKAAIRAKVKEVL